MKKIRLGENPDVAGKYMIACRVSGLNRNIRNDLVRVVGLRSGPTQRIVYRILRGPMKGRTMTSAFDPEQEIKVWTRLGPEIERALRSIRAKAGRHPCF
jgi:hypothetical protein